MQPVYRLRGLVALLASFVLSQPAFAVTDSALMTPGVNEVAPPPPGCPYGRLVFGYDALVPAGSYSPAALTGGNNTVNKLAYNTLCASAIHQLIIGGFTSDPGRDWLTYWICGGPGPVTAASAMGYLYESSTGRAMWTWSNIALQWGDTPTICTIVHN
jgi:hypothetical protein